MGWAAFFSCRYVAGSNTSFCMAADLRACCPLNHTDRLHSLWKWEIKFSESVSLKTRYNQLSRRYQMVFKISHEKWRDSLKKRDTRQVWPKKGFNWTYWGWKTFPYFGGSRYWMKCTGCFRRVRKIYSPPHKTHLRCRKCHDLMYQSQESNVYDGFRRKMAKARGMTPRQYDRMVFGWLYQF